MSPYFTVIVPLYNKAPHVLRALNSITRQTFKLFEVIVVDDASTDDGLEQVLKINDSRLKILKRREAGPGGYAARNLGILESTTNWCVFLDADDEWYDDHLEKMYHLIKKFPHESFFAARFIKSKAGREVRDYVVCNKFILPRRISFFEYLSFAPFNTNTVCIKRELLIGCGMFPEGKMKRGGDVDTWLRAIKNAGGFVMSEHYGAIYHVDSSNMVTKSNCYSEEEVKNTSLIDMIESSEGPVHNKLKKRYNNVLIYAWNQNVHLNCAYNINLIDNVYFGVQPIRCGFFIFLSLFPYFIIKPVHYIGYKIIIFKRWIKLYSFKF
ncbi:MAG: glycosyltransferase family 2 protein [Oceanospirillaceae bacterium]|nr:glycosyltransferase family 2 protein [Oceanospirillaceae bacterium]